MKTSQNICFLFKTEKRKRNSLKCEHLCVNRSCQQGKIDLPQNNNSMLLKDVETSLVLSGRDTSYVNAM